VLRRQLLQCKRPTPRKQGSHHPKGWVLRRGPNKCDRPRLDRLKKHVLLCLRKPMDLIAENNRLAPRQAQLIRRILKQLLHLCHTRARRMYLDKPRPHHPRYTPRNRRLARPRSSPEYHGRQPIRLDERPQHAVGPHKFLPEHVVEGIGPHALRQRRRAVRLGLFGCRGGVRG